MDWKDGAIIVGAGLGVLAWDAMRSYRALSVDIANYQITDVNLSQNRATLQIDVMLTNPLLVGLTLYSIVGDIYLDGDLVARINQKFDYYIRGKRVHVIPLVIQCNLMGVSAILLQKLISDKQQSIALRFNGELRLGTDGLVGLPVDIEEVIEW